MPGHDVLLVMVVADIFWVIRVIFTLIRMLGCRQLRDR